MGLEAVALGRRLAVIADRDRQEVILDVRVFDACFRTQEGSALEMVGGTEPGFEQQPFETDQALGEQVQLRVKADRLGAFLLDIELKMVLQIGTDAGAVRQNLDTMLAGFR